MAEVRREVTNATKLDERGGKESAKTDVNDESTLNNLNDGASDDAIRVTNTLHISPRTLVLGALLGEDEATLFVFFLKNECFD